MKRFPIVLLAFVLLSLMSISAQAEDCNRFTQNAEWKEKFPQLKEEIETGNYTSALETAKVLHGICSRSPALNYLTGVALLKTGDLSRARTSFQKASEYTSEFETEPEMARRIWFARYEAEYPEKSDESISAMKDKIKALEDASLSDKSTSEVISLAQNESNRKKFAGIMWTGTAVGILGVALIIPGAIFLQKENSDEEKNGVKYPLYIEGDNFYSRTYNIKNEYKIGLGLLGAGVAALVAGSVMAGFGGYYYVHSEDKIAIKFDVSPSYAGMRMEF